MRALKKKVTNAQAEVVDSKANFKENSETKEPVLSPSFSPSPKKEEPNIQKAAKPLGAGKSMMGISIKEFMPQKEESSAEKELNINDLPKEPFRLEQVVELWQHKLGEFEKADKVHVLGAIKNVEIRKEEENKVVFIFHSRAAQAEFDKFRHDWLSSVKEALNNFHLQLEVRVEITENNQTLAMKPNELYNEMLKKNPELETLKKKLGLDFYF